MSSMLNAVANDINRTIDPNKEKKILGLILNTLKKSHYNFKQIDDNFSKAVFKSYINLLDADKKFLLQADYLEFKKSEKSLDDQILNNDLTFFYSTYDRIKIRMREAKSQYSMLGKNIFDFTINENYQDNRTSFSKNKDDLKNFWRLRMKKDILDSIINQSNIETIQQKLNPKFTSNTIENLEIKYRNKLLKYYSGTDSDIENLEIEDFFEKYLNAILAQFDPHTTYLKPMAKLEDNYVASGQYLGIGTQTAYIDNFLQIYKFEKGGPAYRDKVLEIGDIILKFQEGANSPIDLVGYQIIDYNRLFSKVNKNTLIKLTVKKPDGTIKVVSLKKEIIEIGNTFVKSCIVEKNGLKFGIICIPKFYKDFSDSTNRDAAKDVEKEIASLKAENVEGIVLDIRNNGGGAVETAIETAALFLNENQIIQLKTRDENINIMKSAVPTSSWNGDLIILINKDTASSSEFFAGAIQDYHRGIIVGSATTFGKGTLQNNIDLNQYISTNSTTDYDYGALKTTTNKIYRINGEATQNKGIISDIILPEENKYEKYGEKYLFNSLLYDKIQPLDYTCFKLNFQKPIELAKKRITENATFNTIEKKALTLSKINIENVQSLNINVLKKTQGLKINEMLPFENLIKFRNNLIFKSTKTELVALKKDVYLSEKRKEWHENLTKDIYIDESINILFDMKMTK